MKQFLCHIIFFACCSCAFAQPVMNTDYTVLRNTDAGAMHVTVQLNTAGILNCYADKIPAKVLVTVTETGTMDVYDWKISNTDARRYQKTFDHFTDKHFTLDINAMQPAKYYEIKVELFNKDNNLPALVVLRKNNTAEATMVRRHEQIDKKDFYEHMRKQDLIRRERDSFWNAAVQKYYVRITRNNDFRHRSIVGLFISGGQNVPMNTAYDDKTPGELLRRIDSMVKNTATYNTAKVADKTAAVNTLIGKYAAGVSNSDADTGAAMFAPVLYLVYAKAANGIVKLHYITAAGWGKSKMITDALDKLFKQPNIY